MIFVLLSRRIKFDCWLSYTCSETTLINSLRYSSFQLSLVQLATSTSIKENRLRNLRQFCPEIQKDFWVCMNKTLESIDRGSHWIGRSCCSQALLPTCQQGLLRSLPSNLRLNVNCILGCAISASVHDLKSFCRQSDELTLFACIDQVERNTECCANANSQDCRQVSLTKTSSKWFNS